MIGGFAANQAPSQKPTACHSERNVVKRRIYSINQCFNRTRVINNKKFIKGKFSWQEGYGAFSYAHSQIEQIYNYILNQEQHHHKRTFEEEYLGFLEKYQLEYDEKYLFEWIG